MARNAMAFDKRIYCFMRPVKFTALVIPPLADRLD